VIGSCDWFGSVSAISLLQLATRAGIPRQSEIRNDYWLASFSLHSLLSLVMSILSTYGTSERRIKTEYSPLAHSEATTSL
jgi:hypothetical protein